MHLQSESSLSTCVACSIQILTTADGQNLIYSIKHSDVQREKCSMLVSLVLMYESHSKRDLDIFWSGCCAIAKSQSCFTMCLL